MSQALVSYETEQGAVQLNSEIIKKYLVNGNGNVTDQEVTMFLNLCKYQKLNPFLREAYLIKFGSEQATIITGKEVFTKRASKNPNCDGWEAGVVAIDKNGQLVYRPGTLVLSSEELVGGWCEVRRKDWSKPQRNEVSLSEYMRTNKDGKPMAQWAKMPGTMIRKVAIVQALRDAFPEDLQGLYAQEEMSVDARLTEEPVVVIESNTIDYRAEIGRMMIEMCEGNVELAGHMLKDITSFEGKDGKVVEGKSKLKDLSEKQLQTTYGKVKTIYSNYTASKAEHAVEEYEEAI